MTFSDNWEQQPGGLYLAVPRFDKTNPAHRGAIDSVMRSVIETVAQTHGASISEKSFRHNLQALYTGEIKIDFFMAKWEVCDPALYLGAALSWDTLGVDPHGRAAPAVYTEDVCILTDKLRELIRSKPNGKDFPVESLAECFERISLQNMFKKDGAFYRFGEVNRDNTKMMRTLDGNGAVIGTGADSAVLEFKRLPNNLLDRFPMDIKVIYLKKDGARDKNNFIVRWKDGPSDIRFIATKGHATALGQPRADIRPWHNGNLPEQDVLECVIASTLLAIKQKAEDRGWGDQPRRYIPSPRIPLLDPQSEIYAALYNACGDEILVNADDRPRTIARPMPDAHVHVLNDEKILKGFTTVGAETRLFGNRPMIPGVNIMRNEIRSILM